MDELFETSQTGESNEVVETNMESPEEVHQLAEQPEEELKQLGVDDPKSFKFWNSKYDKEVNPLKAKVQELERQLQERDSKFSQFENEIQSIKNPPKIDEPLVRPQRPTSGDPIDTMDYLEKLAIYNDKVSEKNMGEFAKFRELTEKERQAQLDIQKQAQYKAFVAGKLQEAGGLNPQEALEAINIYGKAQSNADEYFKDLAEFYKFKKQNGLKAKTKIEQPNAPLPPGINSGTNVPTEDETKAFMGSMGRSDNSWVFESKGK